jgi:Kef-type K+ transport system membrane component KefB
LQVDLDAFVDGETILLLVVVTALAAVAKFGGAWLGARGQEPRDARAIGLGMVPRGEVGIIVASIGAAEGVIDEQLFAVIVGMSILTTLMVPPLLRRVLAEPAPT